jgi:hypothetical protein
LRMDLERQIRTFTGGLLELKPPLRRRDESDTESEETEQRSNSGTDDSVLGLVDDFVSVAFSESASSIGQWTVQPLHQTVKEFLRQPKNLDLLFFASLTCAMEKTPPKDLWKMAMSFF